MAVSFLATLLLICGLFLLLKITPMELANGLFKRLSEQPNSIKAQISEATRRKKKSLIRREISDIQEILRVTGRSDKFSILCVVSLGLAAGGAAVAVLLGNLFLAPVMAVGMLFVPFMYVRLTASHFKKDLAQELETTLSVITNAYLRSEDIVKAIDENIAYGLRNWTIPLTPRTMRTTASMLTRENMSMRANGCSPTRPTPRR